MVEPLKMFARQVKLRTTCPTRLQKNPLLNPVCVIYITADLYRLSILYLSLLHSHRYLK